MSRDTSLRSYFSPRLFFLIMLIGVAAPFAYVMFSRVYSQYVEISAPEIELLEVPRGIGIAPVTLRFRVKDSEAGLDEVVVRSRQRGRMHELLKTKLKGALVSEQEIHFDGTKSGFQEGMVELEIVVFDRAFWSNRGQKDLQFRVDYHRPKVEVLTTQHNARRGGSQLVFYKAFDEEVGLSGVRVGDQVFKGFHANGLDASFEDPNLYVAFYAIDIRRQVEGTPIKVFAEDMVGNSVSTDFYNKVMERPKRHVTVLIPEEVMRTTIPALFDQSAPKLNKYLAEHPNDIQTAAADSELRKFQLLNEVIKPIDQDLIGTLVEKTPRFESFLKQFFLRQGGPTKMWFGDRVSYAYADNIVGEDIALGTEFTLPQNQREILAVNDGIVAISESIGSYGRVIVVDHGLGVASLYAHLDQLKVAKGDPVKRGEVLGLTGMSGFALLPGAYIEMRVHGVPVDPLEWWDATWFNQHVVEKIDDMKRLFGIAVPKPLAFGNK